MESSILHSSITECTIALRLTIGLESHDILDQYIEIIANTHHELIQFTQVNEYLSLLEKVIEIALKHKTLAKPVIAQAALGCSFADFLNKLKGLEWQSNTSSSED